MQELNDNEVQCLHCGYVCDIGALIGETTDNCPQCGKEVLIKEEENA